MTSSLYMTTANTYISPKVIAERFEKYFKIKVTIVEYVITQFNYHYTVVFQEPLPSKYMENDSTNSLKRRRVVHSSKNR